MYGSGYIFSKNFFTGKSVPLFTFPLTRHAHQIHFSRHADLGHTGWVVVGIIWIFCSLFGVGLLPVYEGRQTLAHTFKFIALDIRGKKPYPGKHRHHNNEVPIEGEAEDRKSESVLQDAKAGGVVTPTEK